MTLLVPQSDIGDSISLDLEAGVPGAAGERPAVAVRILICGQHAFKGQLLMAGDARLLEPHLLIPDINGEAAPIHPLTEVGPLKSSTFGTETQLEEVQRIPLSSRPVTPCPSDESVRPPHFGTPIVLEGRLRSPVQTGVEILGIAGPRSVQSWPALGTIVGVEKGDTGAFKIPDVEGQLYRPRGMSFGVSIGALTNRGEIEYSRPVLPTSGDLRWSEKAPFAATARFLNREALSNFNSWTTGLAIAFGIFGSILGSLLLDAVRRQRITRPQSNSPLQPDPPIAVRAARYSAVRVISPFVFAIGLLVLLQFRRRRRY
jgi:hypothetical protein